MTVIVRSLAVILLALTCAVLPIAARGQPPEQQNEFIPIDQLPPAEQMPAAPLLIGAYAFVVVTLFAYLLSVSRRLGVVQREVTRLEAEMKRTGSASAEAAADKRG